MEITCNLKTKFFCTKRLMWEPLKFGTVLIKVVFCFDCCPHRCLFQCWRCSCSETEALTVFKLRLQNFPMRYICTVGAKRRPDIFLLVLHKSSRLRLMINSLFTLSGTEELTYVSGLMAPAVFPACQSPAESLWYEPTVLNISPAPPHPLTPPLLMGRVALR